MKKYIRITMPDGSLWDVPADIVADNRAEYYKEDGYDDEFQYAMEDDSILFDWAAGNMNWDDVKEYATQFFPPDTEANFQEGWVNGDKKTVMKG